MSDQNALLIEEISRLKKERKAVILAHNYQIDEVQEIADMTGDSLELARAGRDADCEVIVLCGVLFMAESAAVLSPRKTVLLPEPDAVCPMADMIEVERKRKVWKKFPGYEKQPEFVFPHDFTLRDIKAKYPGAPVVAYVNTTAEVKAESDVCCTSANVVSVVNSLPDETVICIPDKNLSMWAQKNSQKRIIAWDGFCHVHDRVTVHDVESARKVYPNAEVLAHPECRIEVLEIADHVDSTSGMMKYVKTSAAGEFIVGTERGMLYRLRKENPGKQFHALREDMLCPNMKRTTLQSVLDALKNMEQVITVPEDISVRAKKALDRMVAIK
jgi:quinolinate synthase